MATQPASRPKLSPSIHRGANLLATIIEEEKAQAVASVRRERDELEFRFVQYREAATLQQQLSSKQFKECAETLKRTAEELASSLQQLATARKEAEEANHIIKALGVSAPAYDPDSSTPVDWPEKFRVLLKERDEMKRALEREVASLNAQLMTLKQEVELMKTKSSSPDKERSPSAPAPAVKTPSHMSADALATLDSLRTLKFRKASSKAPLPNTLTKRPRTDSAASTKSPSTPTSSSETANGSKRPRLGTFTPSSDQETQVARSSVKQEEGSSMQVNTAANPHKGRSTNPSSGATPGPSPSNQTDKKPIRANDTSLTTNTTQVPPSARTTPPAGNNNNDPPLAVVEEDPSKRYCYCNEPSYGVMIACDSPAGCRLKWFHLPCIGLTTAPDGPWICPSCSSLESSS